MAVNSNALKLKLLNQLEQLELDKSNKEAIKHLVEKDADFQIKRNDLELFIDFLISFDKCWRDQSSTNTLNKEDKLIKLELEILDLVFDSTNINIIYQTSRDNSTPYAEFNGYSPLMMACKIGNLPIVEYLVAKGALIHQKSTVTNPLLYVKDISTNVLSPKIPSEPINEYTPLLAAVAGKNIHCVNYLVDRGAAVWQITENGWHAFRIAYLMFVMGKNGDLNFFKGLLNLGAIAEISPSDLAAYPRMSNHNWESVHATFFVGLANIQQFFKIARRGSYSDEDSSGISIILESKVLFADPLLVRNSTLDSVLHVSAKSGNAEMLESMLQLSKSLDKNYQIRILCSLNAKNETPLDCAVAHSNRKIAGEMILHLKNAILQLTKEILDSLYSMPAMGNLPEDNMQQILSFCFKAPTTLFAHSIKGRHEMMKFFAEAKTSAMNAANLEKFIAQKYHEMGEYYLTKCAILRDSERMQVRDGAMRCFLLAAKRGHISAKERLSKLGYKGPIITSKNLKERQCHKPEKSRPADFSVNFIIEPSNQAKPKKLNYFL